MNDLELLNRAISESDKGRCSRRKIACVITDKNGEILCYGYNGPPAPMESCLVNPCPGANVAPGQGATEIVECYGIHSEIAAIIELGKRGLLNKAHAIYCNKAPCRNCVPALIATPIKKIVFRIMSRETINRDLWLSAGREWKEIGES